MFGSTTVLGWEENIIAREHCFNFQNLSKDIFYKEYKEKEKKCFLWEIQKRAKTLCSVIKYNNAKERENIL